MISVAEHPVGFFGGDDETMIDRAGLQKFARHFDSENADGAVERITGSARGQFNFYGPSPEPGSILRLWDFADADRIVMVSKNLDPGNRIRTGRPLR